MANFVGKPAALVTGMGYVKNSAILPVLIGNACTCVINFKYAPFNISLYVHSLRSSNHSQGGLIISDSLNHNSIVNGARGSGATIRVFLHNSMFH